MKAKLFLLLATVLLALIANNAVAQRKDSRVTAVQPKIKIFDLRVEQMVDPQGIDELKPVFAWKPLNDNLFGTQESYRIIVKKITPAENLRYATVWDTGTVKSKQSANIPYEGEPLASGAAYVWTVEVTLKNEKPGGVVRMLQSHEAKFSMGLLAENDWQAKWIGLDETKDDAPKASLNGSKWIWTNADASPAPGNAVFRKTFDLPAGFKSAAAAFTADNGYSLYINGEKASAGTNFKTAAAGDVTRLLKAGKNAIAVEVSNVGSEPNPAGLIGVLSLTLDNGEKTEIRTDADWKAADGTPEKSTEEVFDDTAWKNAVATNELGGGPWGEISVDTVRESLPARYLRKDFFIEEKKDIKRATVYVCGLGYYELYFNGAKLGDHVLDPVLTDYDKRVPYVAYEIDPQRIEKGMRDIRFSNETAAWIQMKNVFGVILGNGRYYAPRTTDPTFTKTYGYPKLLLQCVIEFSDGTKKTIVSDESWKMTTEGPIQDNNDYDGEIRDARKELHYWNRQYIPNEPSFGDELFGKGWQDAKIVEPPKGKLVAQMMEPMRVTGTLKPISFQEVKPGVWVYDFGQNFVGVCELKLPKTEPGTKITLRHAETLQSEGAEKGMLYLANLRNAKCRDIYYTAGHEKETYRPTFTYHGFRYAELTGYPGKPKLDTLNGIVTGTDLKVVGKFECSNETITKFAKNIEWGTRGNYLSIPTDCPQRDERQGWQGDRAGEMPGEMFMFDNYTLYKKWMADIEDSQKDDGNLSDVCPNYWPMYGSNVTWPSAFTFIPEHLYKVYGDRRIIERHYPAMKKWLIGHLGQFVKDGLIDKDNYGDWCVPPEKKELIHSADPARKTNQTLLATSYYIYNLKLLARYAEMLGKPEDQKEFLAKAGEMTAAFNKRFYDAEKGEYDNGTQTSCVLPLAFGLVPEGEEEKVFATLVSNIDNVTHGNIGTGLVGGQWLAGVLSNHGRDDIYYKFATNTDYPSWGYMLKSGATTVWELWNGNTADPAMNSGNHVMLVGDYVIWLYSHLGGISGDIGYEKIELCPHVVGDLKFVKCEYDSPRGVIRSDWMLKNGRFIFDATVPFNTEATVRIPCSVNEQAKIAVPPGAVFKEFSEGRAVFEVPSGVYRFAVPYELK